MNDTGSSNSPLEVVAGTVGLRTVEAFSALGNETRLSILLALWEAYEPFGETNAVPFADLRKRLGMRDGSQFNYHLKQLTGLFVRKTDDGYELHRAGHQLVRTIIAGAGFEDPAFERIESDRDCRLCGAPTVLTYQKGWLFNICTECEGAFKIYDDEFPDGTLDALEPNPAGFVGRSPGELFDAAVIHAFSEVLAAIEGVCSACSGPMEGWLDRCEDHATEGVCPNCKRHDALLGKFRCEVCKHSMGVPVWGLVRYHPATVAFFYDHGVPLLYDAGSFRNLVPGHVDPPATTTDELVSEDPPRVRVTIEHEGEQLRLTVDEALAVSDVRRG
ncbi:MAG: helix-turn-helix domain-containing protein [Halobacteriales archaeon]|nr:helix-turn-helix domain-containing protein [Halobacteriales archaeon]